MEVPKSTQRSPRKAKGKPAEPIAIGLIILRGWSLCCITGGMAERKGTRFEWDYGAGEAEGDRVGAAVGLIV